VLFRSRLALDELPDDITIDDSDPADDLLLQRTLRAMREQSRPPSVTGRARWLGVAAAVVVLVGAALGGGVVIGHGTAHRPTVALSTVPGTRTIDASNAATGAGFHATIVPKKGWVAIDVHVTGVKAGERCRLIALPSAGAPEIAASWVVSDIGAGPAGTTVHGSAAVAPDALRSLQVVTEDGRTLVTANV